MFGSVFCGEFEKCQCLGWLLQHPRVACDVICKLAYDKPPHALECSRWQKSELLSVILIMEIKGLFILFIYYFFYHHSSTPCCNTSVFSPKERQGRKAHYFLALMPFLYLHLPGGFFLNRAPARVAGALLNSIPLPPRLGFTGCHQ